MAIYRPGELEKNHITQAASEHLVLYTSESWSVQKLFILILEVSRHYAHPLFASISGVSRDTAGRAIILLARDRRKVEDSTPATKMIRYFLVISWNEAGATILLLFLSGRHVFSLVNSLWCFVGAIVVQNDSELAQQMELTSI
jgi:hypothetical protein